MARHIFQAPMLSGSDTSHPADGDASSSLDPDSRTSSQMSMSDAPSSETGNPIYSAYSPAGPAALPPNHPLAAKSVRTSRSRHRRKTDKGKAAKSKAPPLGHKPSPGPLRDTPARGRSNRKQRLVTKQPKVSSQKTLPSPGPPPSSRSLSSSPMRSGSTTSSGSWRPQFRSSPAPKASEALTSTSNASAGGHDVPVLGLLSNGQTHPHPLLAGLSPMQDTLESGQSGPVVETGPKLVRRSSFASETGKPPLPALGVNNNSTENTHGSTGDLVVPVYRPSELTESKRTARLLLVSSEVKSFTVLHNATKVESVWVVQYDFANATLDSLIKCAQDALRDVGTEGWLSIAIIAAGEPGALHLCAKPEPLDLTAASLDKNGDIKNFIHALVGTMVQHDGGGRIDILATHAGDGAKGARLHAALAGLLGTVPVFLSTHAAPHPDEVSHGDSDITQVSSQYFDLAKIGRWVGPYTQTLAEYERVCVIGKGAFGSATLYRKRDEGSYVILKSVMMQELSNAERELALNEHVVLSRLKHPNIVEYFDSFEEDGMLLIEMEYADGGTLAQFLFNRNGVEVPEIQIVRIFRQIVDAIAYIHGKRILHRDLKTQNVFLTLDSIVKVGDFGIAKQLNDSKKKAHTLLGTPNYISPEHCQGLPYDDKSDIWSLGCILYEMAMLHKPFDGSNLPALVEKIVNGEIDPISDMYSDNIRSATDQMLQREASMRPTATEIQDFPICNMRGDDSDIDDDGIGDLHESDICSSVFYWESDSHIPRRFSFENKINITQVAVGTAHAAALTSEGLVFSWGSNNHGQLGHGDLLTRSNPQVVAALLNKPTKRIACGGDVTALLSTGGLLQLCGRGEYGTLGNGDNSDKALPHLVQAFLLLEVVDVAVGSFHAAAVTIDPPALYTWGRSSKGRLGLGKNVDPMYSTPQLVDLNGICIPSEVKCGLNGTMLMSNHQSLFATGSNDQNKLGLNSRPSILRHRGARRSKAVSTAYKFTSVASLGKCDVFGMAAGDQFGAALTSTGSCFMFGSNTVGGLGCGNTKQIRGAFTTVKSVLANYSVLDVTCGETFTVVKVSGKRDSSSKGLRNSILNTSKVFAWGRGMADRCEKLATDDHNSIYLPSELRLAENGAFQEVTSIAAHRGALIVAINSADSQRGETQITRKLSNAVDNSKIFVSPTKSDSSMMNPIMGTRNGPLLRNFSVVSHAEHEEVFESDIDDEDDDLDTTPRWLRDEYVAAVDDAYAKAQYANGSGSKVGTTEKRRSVERSRSSEESPTNTRKRVVEFSDPLSISQTKVPFDDDLDSRVGSAVSSVSTQESTISRAGSAVSTSSARPYTAPQLVRPETWGLHDFLSPPRPSIRQVESHNFAVRVDLAALREFTAEHTTTLDRIRHKASLPGTLERNAKLPDEEEIPQYRRGSAADQRELKKFLQENCSHTPLQMPSSPNSPGHLTIPSNFIFDSTVAEATSMSIPDVVSDLDSNLSMMEDSDEEYTNKELQQRLNRLETRLSKVNATMKKKDKKINSLQKQLKEANLKVNSLVDDGAPGVASKSTHKEQQVQNITKTCTIL